MVKNKCDCPCVGPYCNSLIHPCQKPDEHYPQRDEAVVEITKAGQLQVLKELLKEVKKNPHGCDNTWCFANQEFLDLIQTKIQSLEEK